MDHAFRELTSEEMSAVAGGGGGLLGGGLGTLVNNLLHNLLGSLLGGTPVPPLLVALLAWLRRELTTSSHN